LECVMTRSFKTLALANPLALAKPLALAMAIAAGMALPAAAQTATVGGAATGAVAGALVGGPVGAAVGGAAGLVAGSTVDAANSRTVVVPADAMPTGTIVQQRVIVLDARTQAAWNRCASLYKTFNPNTGEFIGEDGLVHLCQ